MVALFLTHWFQFNYFPHGEVWYRGAVWPNVFVLAPLSLLAVAGWLWHKGAVEEVHRKLDEAAKRADVHAEHMKRILDALDPDTESESQLDVIADRVDETTPGGLKSVLDALAKKSRIAKAKARG